MDKIINDLCDFLKSQEKLIMNANKIDVENKNDKIDMNELVSALHIDEDFVYYGKHKSKYKNKEYTITNVYDNYGTIGIDCENNLMYPIFRIVAMCILTRNKALINIKEGKNYATINMITILVNKFMEALKVNNFITLTTPDDRDFYRDGERIGKIIVVSSKGYYEDHVMATNLPCAYYDISMPTVIITDKNYEKQLDSLVGSPVVTTVELDKKHRLERFVSNLDEAMKYVNERMPKSKTILLTGNNEEAVKFLNSCKSQLAFVNVVSSNISMPNFNQMDFLYIKSMISPK